MAELAGVFAASHGPLIVRDWHRVPPAQQAQMTAAFQGLGRRLMAARPDVIIEISPDHWTNFFLDNLPSVCIGLGDLHEGPPEPFLKDFPHKTLRGDAALGQHLLETALEHDFEPSASHHLVLDHGFCIPLWRMELDYMPPIVPIIVNDLEPPMLSLRRCLQWGRLIREAIEAYPKKTRIAVLATGGMSHSIGETTMGEIDEVFDRLCIDVLRQGDEAALVNRLTAALAIAGNGAHEMRNWVVAHGVAGGRGFDLIDYLPIPEVYVGCGFASWAV